MAIDPYQFLPMILEQQPSPYGGPIGAISQGLSRVLLARTLAPHLRARMTQDEEERRRRQELSLMYLQAQREQLEREPLQRRYDFILSLYKQDFEAAYKGSKEFRDLTEQLKGYRAPEVPITAQIGVQRPEEGGLSRFLAPAGMQQVQTGTRFQLPGGGTNFRTIGELATGLGLRLKPGIAPDLPVADLRAQGVDINSLLLDPREEAQATLKWLADTYGRQVQSNPVLWKQYVEAFRTATGQEWPTEKVPETFTAGGVGSPSEAIRAQTGTQIPTGRTIERPILPQAGAQIMVNIPGVGQVPLEQLPAGAQTAIITRMFDERSKVEVTLKNGQKVLVSPEKAADLDRQQQVSMVTFRDPSTGAVVTIPATAIPSFFPRKAPGGPVSTEGLTPAQKRTVDSYNRLVDQRTRLQQMVAQGVADAAMQTRLQADIADLDRRIGQLQPEVDRILGIGGRPSPAAGAMSPDVVGWIQTAAKQNVPFAQVQAWAQQNGLDLRAVKAEYDRARGGVRPQPSMKGMAGFVRNLKQQGVPWQSARIALIQELVRRGVSPADAAKIVDNKRLVETNWSP